MLIKLCNSTQFTIKISILTQLLKEQLQYQGWGNMVQFEKVVPESDHQSLQHYVCADIFLEKLEIYVKYH